MTKPRVLAGWRGSDSRRSKRKHAREFAGRIAEEQRFIMQGAMNREFRTTFRQGALLALGWTLLVLGAVGLFLPVVPGTVLLLAGGNILCRQSPGYRRLRKSLKSASIGTPGPAWARRFHVALTNDKSAALITNGGFRAPRVSALGANHATRSPKTSEQS